MLAHSDQAKADKALSDTTKTFEHATLTKDTKALEEVTKKVPQTVGLLFNASQLRFMSSSSRSMHGGDA